jgi:hypothetical protein
MVRLFALEGLTPRQRLICLNNVCNPILSPERRLEKRIIYLFYDFKPSVEAGVEREWSRNPYPTVAQPRHLTSRQPLPTNGGALFARRIHLVLAKLDIARPTALDIGQYRPDISIGEFLGKTRHVAFKLGRRHVLAAVFDIGKEVGVGVMPGMTRLVMGRRAQAATAKGCLPILLPLQILAVTYGAMGSVELGALRHLGGVFRIGALDPPQSQITHNRRRRERANPDPLPRDFLGCLLVSILGSLLVRSLFFFRDHGELNTFHNQN